MARSLNRQIALNLCLEQLENAAYLLEREEYAGLSEKNNEAIQMEMQRILIAFRKYYDLPT